LNTLLRLQDLDLQIEALKAREQEIPKQKGKFDVRRKRLAEEFTEREKVVKALILEQKDCESEIEQKQGQIKKYDQQLLSIKKNEEYQALLHEMEMLKKQIAIKEEREISIMVEIDDAKARLEADKKRIDDELKDIDRQCSLIDAELGEAVLERESLEKQIEPLTLRVKPELISRYKRIRQNKGVGAAVVPLNGEACSGCHMRVTPQLVNELLGGSQQLACNYCGRMLYDPQTYSINGPETD
jgi:predicted  nucleic acid-binding Zn-ribbon protein